MQENDYHQYASSSLSLRYVQDRSAHVPYAARVREPCFFSYFHAPHLFCCAFAVSMHARRKESDVTKLFVLLLARLLPKVHLCYDLCHTLVFFIVATVRLRCTA